MTDAPLQTESGKALQTPGELLKQAREKLGLAQKDIAAQLNLQAEIIDAVEKNDRDRLPVATYFRGYVRSYARLVKLDADMLIGLYDQESTPPPEIIPNIKKPTQASSRDKPVVAITYLITFIMALLVVAWLIGKNSGNGTPDTASSGAKTGQRAEPSLQHPETGPAVATPRSVQEQSYPAPESHTLPPVVTAPPENLISGAESQDKPVIDTNLPAAINPAPTSKNLMNGESRLELSVNHDSWIEVYDADKNKMYHGLAQAGSEIKLAGKTPFSVLLGFAPGVTVRFNEEPFNTAPFSNADIARFTLGAKDHQE